MNRLVYVLFLLPFFFVTLNIQAFITKFYSNSAAQLFAYLNLCLIVFGVVFIFNKRHKFVKTINWWIVFFICYFFFGTIASIIHDTASPYLASLIPVLYFLGFSFFLSIPENNRIFIRTAIVAFFLSTVCTIIFQWYNFSMDYNGISEYRLDRAGGVYGDANQAALASLITFVLIYYKYVVSNKIQGIFKILLLIVTIYALILTFSKTGFVVLLVVLGITFGRLLTLRNSLWMIMFLIALFTIFLNYTLEIPNLSAQQQARIENVIDIITLNTSKIEFSERDVLLKNMLNYVYDNPIIGNGISFSNIIRGHNTIIGVWADSGIVTFIVFLYLLSRYYKQAILSRGVKRNFTLCVIFILSVFMLSLQTVINQPYLIALFVYLAYYIDQEGKQPNESFTN